MLEKEVILISGIFSSFDGRVKFWDETFTASFCIESVAGAIFFFPVHPLNRTDSNSNIITVVTILLLDTISFLPFYFIFRPAIYTVRIIIIEMTTSNPAALSVRAATGKVPTGIVTSGISGTSFTVTSSGIICVPAIFVG